MNITHFGINIKDKPSNHINKELYLSAKPEGLPGWTEDHYAKQVVRADFNFDLNMAYFHSLDFNEFNEYIEKRVKKHKFIESFDLKALDGVMGVYMLVLAEYKQVYIGMSENIKKRIMGHWNGKKSLEKLIFGDVCSSILSIDSFGALDTTRIFYIETSSTYKTEEKIVKSFDSGYMLNRTAGGIGTFENYTDTKASATLAVLANQKRRDLTDFIDIDRLKEIVSKREFDHYLRRYPKLASKL